MSKHFISDSKLIELPRYLDKRGNLSFAEQSNQVPFIIKRTYWIYDVPGGGERGGHAFYKNDEFIISLSGSFDVIIKDGNSERVYSLNRSYQAVYIPRGLWRELRNFSTNSVALVMASNVYDAQDYVHDFKQYIKERNNDKI